MESVLAPTQFGMPTYNQALDSILQQYDDSCAIKAQEIVLNAAGIPATESTLCEIAITNGWYYPGLGTPMEDVGKLMETYGFNVQQLSKGSFYNLVCELSQGHPVIVGVDSGELWNPGPSETFEDIIQGECPDHALIVAGIDFNADFSKGVINLIDPGTGDFSIGYDINQFADAWADSGNFMVTIK